MDDNIFNDINVGVILFNKLSQYTILNYINEDKNKFKQIIYNKLNLLIAKYKKYTMQQNIHIPGENNNITYLKRYITYLNTIINNNYQICNNEINIIINILNESIIIFLEKIKMKTIDNNKQLIFYKNNYKSECWINKLINILVCQPVFTKHFEKYIKEAYINYVNKTDNKLQLTKMYITQPEYNYIFYNLSLYNYDTLQIIFENINTTHIINLNKFTNITENTNIKIIDPYYILPLYNNRFYYQFDKSGYCLNDDNFERIYNISNVLIDTNYYYINIDNQKKSIIHITDIKNNKILNDLLNIYVCLIYNDNYYLIENNESLSFNSLVVNTQKSEKNAKNCINIKDINNWVFDDKYINNIKYAYGQTKEYLNYTSIYTPHNGLNISYTFKSLSSIINEYYTKNNNILYIISYNIIKIFKDTLYKNRINILNEPLFYVFDLLNEYSNFNIPLSQSPEPSELSLLSENKSISTNNLCNSNKITAKQKSISLNNLKNIQINNSFHNFLLNSAFYELFDK